MPERRLFKPRSHHANHIAQRPRRHFNVQRDAFMPAIRRHDLHACFAAQRLLQNAPRPAGVKPRQDEIKGNYCLKFSRGPNERLGHRNRRGTDRGSNACLKHREVRRLATGGGGNNSTLASGALTRGMDRCGPRKESVNRAWAQTGGQRQAPPECPRAPASRHAAQTPRPSS
ncbi:hypothetical protein AWB69_00988 [Caballeronia udeis]|uniref:Uncharacterized protein n=1 Tax=Caballeronia udeis TaxID=1232866 RepID=A0A158FEJ0_9BURK|nr:hypothetical protein AWB69_00988 [Caballeronia udeis]